MAELAWSPDALTQSWAQRIELPLPTQPAPQYDGSAQRPVAGKWQKHLRTRDFSAHCYIPGTDRLLPSPSNIIMSVQSGALLEALALTVAWGGMTRRKPAIYTAPNEVIERALARATDAMRHENSAQGAWELLVAELTWSDVITSKFLHFVARALGSEETPPVPIDNLVVAQHVWPRFRKLIREARNAGDPPLPQGWRDPDHSWDAYNRYMTAVISWSESRGWTTTEIETSLFEAYYPRAV